MSLVAPISVRLLHRFPSCGHPELFSLRQIVLLSYFVKRCLMSESPRSRRNIPCPTGVQNPFFHFGCWRELPCWAVGVFVVAEVDLSSSCVHLFLLVRF